MYESVCVSFRFAYKGCHIKLNCIEIDREKKRVNKKMAEKKMNKFNVLGIKCKMKDVIN